MEATGDINIHSSFKSFLYNIVNNIINNKENEEDNLCHMESDITNYRNHDIKTRKNILFNVTIPNKEEIYNQIDKNKKSIFESRRELNINPKKKRKNKKYKKNKFYKKNCKKI